jgi:hypothetical protein
MARNLKSVQSNISDYDRNGEIKRTSQNNEDSHCPFHENTELHTQGSLNQSTQEGNNEDINEDLFVKKNHHKRKSKSQSFDSNNPDMHKSIVNGNSLCDSRILRRRESSKKEEEIPESISKISVCANAGFERKSMENVFSSVLDVDHLATHSQFSVVNNKLCIDEPYNISHVQYLSQPSSNSIRCCTCNGRNGRCVNCKCTRMKRHCFNCMPMRKSLCKNHANDPEVFISDTVTNDFHPLEDCHPEVFSNRSVSFERDEVCERSVDPYPLRKREVAVSTQVELENELRETKCEARSDDLVSNSAKTQQFKPVTIQEHNNVAGSSSQPVENSNIRCCPCNGRSGKCVNCICVRQMRTCINCRSIDTKECKNDQQNPGNGNHEMIQCTVCQRSFKNQMSLSQHFRQAHPVAVMSNRHQLSTNQSANLDINTLNKAPNLKLLFEQKLASINNSDVCSEENWKNFISVYSEIENQIQSSQPQFNEKRKTKTDRLRSGKKNTPINEAARLSYERKRSQFLFFHQKKKLWNKIKNIHNESSAISSDCFTSEEIYNHFCDIFSKPKSHRLPEDMIKSSDEMRTANLISADNLKDFQFSIENVKKTFLSMSELTAAGPDRIDIKTIKKIDSDFSIHHLIFNIQLKYGRILPQWNKGRLCLLPKPGKDPKILSNLRPLTIYNIGLRALMKAMTSVVQPFTNIHPAQKGFVPGQGCIDNIMKVRQTIDHAIKYKRQLWVTSFDAKAAFDSGSRVHMKDCIESLCLPEHIRNLYLQSLQPTEVTCRINNVISPPIVIVNGVGQGRPESAMTFNLSIDHVIRKIDEMHCGYFIDDENCIKILAYADDIITFASNKQEAEEQAKILIEMLQMIGMNINIEKCICVCINPSPNVSPSNTNQILSSEIPIPTLFDDAKFKYLGCEITTHSRPDYFSWSQGIAQSIKNLIEYPHLLNWQKLEMFKTFVIPQLPYKAQIEALNDPSKIESISNLLETVQLALKSMIGLQCIPLRHLYGSRPAGLACPNGHWSISNNVLNTLSRLNKTSDQVLISLSHQLQIDYEAKISCELNNIRSSPLFDNQLETEQIKIILNDSKKCKLKRITEFLRKQCISLWIGTKTGTASGSQIIQESVSPMSAIDIAPHLTKSQFLAAIQIRSGCVNLKTRPHLRYRSDNINCRMCGVAAETIGHVLGKCHELHNMIVQRHDTVVDLLFKFFSTKPNLIVNKEQAFHVEGHMLKPDIVCTDTQHNKIIIIDPTIRIEKDLETRESQIIEKITKYAPLKVYLANHYRMNIEDVHILPFWIGARGTILKRDIKGIEKHLGKLNKELLKKILIDTVSWSSSIYNKLIFHKT